MSQTTQSSCPWNEVKWREVNEWARARVERKLNKSVIRYNVMTGMQV